MDNMPRKVSERHHYASKLGAFDVKILIIAILSLFLVVSMILIVMIFQREIELTREIDNLKQEILDAQEEDEEEDETEVTVDQESEESTQTQQSTVATTQVTTEASQTAMSTVATTSVAVTVPSYSNPDTMYSSYAHIKSFDPVTGLATFDYFDLLQGDAAIDWLVEQEEYTQAEAEERVNNFADSEFIEKNVNPQLRTVEMKKVSIRMMYDAAGNVSTNAETFPLSFEEFVSLYTLHSDYVMNSFFFYVTVEDGDVIGVEQVYWP